MIPIRFGPAGISDSFTQTGHRSTIQIPHYLRSMELSAFEYQCGRGVRVSDDLAAALKAEAAKYDVALSIHAPYYINLANPEPEKREKTIGYILQTLDAAVRMGAGRIVVHTGSLMGMGRSEALAIAKTTLRLALERADDRGFGEVRLCPETMGKINQLGDLEEVLELCTLDERLMPTIDFGHLNARSLGKAGSYEAYEHIVSRIAAVLGEERGRRFHAHFSKIAYTAGGEKCHLTFADDVYGPRFEPLAVVLSERKLAPVIICESAGTQSEDAATMHSLCRAAGMDC